MVLNLKFKKRCQYVVKMMNVHMREDVVQGIEAKVLRRKCFKNTRKKKGLHSYQSNPPEITCGLQVGYYLLVKICHYYAVKIVGLTVIGLLTRTAVPTFLYLQTPPRKLSVLQTRA